MNEETMHGIRRRLCKIGRQLHDRGLVSGAAGNISARIPETEQILIKPTGVSMGFLKPEDLILVSIQGKQIEGQRTMSVETPTHTAIYRTRGDINGIVHSHAPIATAFGIAGIEILPVTIETLMFIPNGVPIVPFEKPGSKELAAAVQRRITEYDAVILENHGILTVGPTIEEACSLNITVEQTARLQFMAKLLTGKETVTMESLKRKYEV